VCVCVCVLGEGGGMKIIVTELIKNFLGCL
jgi:hypothetical protein